MWLGVSICAYTQLRRESMPCPLEVGRQPSRRGLSTLTVVGRLGGSQATCDPLFSPQAESPGSCLLRGWSRRWCGLSEAGVHS